MTSRERLLSVIHGEEPDQTPVVVWPPGEYYSDAAIVKINRLANAGHSPRVVLAEILNPLGRAIANGVDLPQLLHDNPTEGEAMLQSLIFDVEQEIDFALKSGVDGIFYRLQGAEPKYTTPMQYGGHFLEVDRALLRRLQIPDSRFRIAGEAEEIEGGDRESFNEKRKPTVAFLFVESGAETYIDCLTDLPADVFAWDRDTLGATIVEMRLLRQGVLATKDEQADILFGHNYGLLQSLIQHFETTEAHV